MDIKTLFFEDNMVRITTMHKSYNEPYNRVYDLRNFRNVRKQILGYGRETLIKLEIGAGWLPVPIESAQKIKGRGNSKVYRITYIHGQNSSPTSRVYMWDNDIARFFRSAKESPQVYHDISVQVLSGWMEIDKEMANTI